MTWRDHYGSGEDNPYGRMGRPGGDWHGLRPSFDNPATWAITFGRVAGVELRVHLVFLLFIVIELARAGVQSSGAGMLIVGAMLTVLFGIVLLHEFGHVIACRASGGNANEILMWPLGGLAFVQPPHNWRAHMMTVLGGPLVNVLICIVTGIPLGIATGRWLGAALPNPLDLFGPAAYITGWPLLGLYLINAMSFVLLLFNLLPLFPLDGGRIVQAALWPRFGYVRSMRIAVRTGYIGAILLAIFGFVFNHLMLVLIAVFGALTCYITHRQLQFTEEMLGYESDEYALGLSSSTGDDESAHPSRAERRAERAREREERESRELDRILQKIADSGMASLSRSEKKLLDRVSARKRSSAS